MEQNYIRASCDNCTPFRTGVSQTSASCLAQSFDSRNSPTSHTIPHRSFTDIGIMSCANRQSHYNNNYKQLANIALHSSTGVSQNSQSTRAPSLTQNSSPQTLYQLHVSILCDSFKLSRNKFDNKRITNPRPPLVALDPKAKQFSRTPRSSGRPRRRPWWRRPRPRRRGQSRPAAAR